jgi:glycopeptide antibiotics resistance protein
LPAAALAIRERQEHCFAGLVIPQLKCRRATSGILLAGWTAAIVLAVVPMGRYRDRPAWQQIAWIPFVSWPVTLDDSVRNVLLYVPFGYLQARAAVYSTAWRAVAHATALSAGTEATQVYSRGRYPSTTDVVCNLIGAMMGFAWARRRTSRASYRPAGTPAKATNR